MSVRDLNLGQLSLADSACNLKLSVTASGAFSLPPNLSSLNDTELQEALLSGRIWTARGRACRISIRVSFNGRPLDADNRLQVLKSIGYQCRDAHVSKLCWLCGMYVLLISQAVDSALSLIVSRYSSV